MVCAEGSEGLIAIPWLRPLSIVWQAVADRDLLCLDGALLVPIEVIETILTFDDRFEELVDIVGGTRGVHPSGGLVETLIDEELAPGQGTIGIESLLTDYICFVSEVKGRSEEHTSELQSRGHL